MELTLARLNVSKAIFLERMIRADRLKGRSISELRGRIACGTVQLPIIDLRIVTASIDAMDRVCPAQPAPTPLVRLTLESAAMGMGGVAQAKVWQALGVCPYRGLRLLHSRRIEPTWPEWCMLWDASVGPARLRLVWDEGNS